MTIARIGWIKGPGALVRLRRIGVLLGCASSLAACSFTGLRAEGNSMGRQDVAAVAGWTRIATTQSYLVVANVLPGEVMFTAAQADAAHPTEGELIIHGIGNSVGPNVRHVEAHVYDLGTGLPLNNVTTTIALLNLTTGDHIDVEPTLMQDVNIGAPDIHYGNNITVASDSDVRLVITINDEEVTLDGHLD